MKKFIGIDPGKSGGIAVYCEETDIGTISAHKCPENEGDMYALVEIMASGGDLKDVYTILEHVWAFPTDSSKTAFTFGRNFGSWITILEILGINYDLAGPRKWQSHFKTPKLVKKERKRWLKELAQDYVNTTEEPFRVTFNTSDAIMIAVYNFEKSIEK